MATMTLEEKLAKIRSPNLESQQQTASILKAVEATLEEQNTEASATSYLAALSALLSQTISAGESRKGLITPIVYLLDIVAPYAPQPLLRAKFTHLFSLLAPVVSQPDSDAPLLRPSIGCLESLLLAQDSVAWAMSAAQVSPRRAVAGLLNLAADHRPKVRKRAQEALRKVLQNPPPSPSLDHPAAALCAATAMQSLANLASKSEPMKKSKSAGQRHDPDMMHALQLVKTVAAASGGWPAKDIEPLCELVLGIARSANEHLTMAVFEIFEMIFTGMARDEFTASKLPRLLEAISELRPAASDTQSLPAWLAILSRGYDVAAQVWPDDTFVKLPELFTMISGFLDSQAVNVRISASECLVSFVANCIPDRVLLDASVYDEKVLERLATVVESLLSVRYQAARSQTFKVIGAIFDSLRWKAQPFFLNVTKTIGDMRGSTSFEGKKEADEVLGKAIRSMGPAAVLKVLPLNLAKPAKDEPGRAWMLPLLRDYTANTDLAHFRTELVPLSEIMFQRVLDQGEKEKTMEVKIYETVVQQIWSVLPGYCDLPLDLREAFDQSFAEMLANILYQQVALRLDVCRALKILVESNKSVASIEEDDDLLLQSRISKEEAHKNLEYLGTYSGNILAVLFNVYGQTAAQTRGLVLQTIDTFLSITPATQIESTFNDVYRMLRPLLTAPVSKGGTGNSQEAKEKVPSTSHDLMDLAITLSVYLSRETYGPLFELASLAVLREDDAQLQKKAYRLIPRLAGSSVGKAALQGRQSELHDLLVASAEKVTAPARRERLAAVAALVNVVSDSSLHVIPALLSEVVISCKEHNERARNTAFEALVLMGNRMAAANGALIDNSKVQHMPADAPAAHASIEEFFTMVSAGLAGSTPHMISASITALARILYEFRTTLREDVIADLVQTMDLFLTSNNREIVKSVLGFVKVSVIGLPADMMLPRIATLIPNLMIWSHEHKGHFRAKVKHILERMVRRFGFDMVHKHCPEDDKKLIVNIRKTKDRNKKKKDGVKGHGQVEDDEEGQTAKRTGRFEDEFDEALYTSDESDESEDDAKPQKAGVKATTRRKNGNAYIVEDPDEPLDLLSRGALASISTTMPMKPRRKTQSKAKVDVAGKLVIGDHNDAMDIDTAEGPTTEDGGVDAYVAALKSRDTPRRGQRGKLKFSNSSKRKRGHDDDENDDKGDEMVLDRAEASLVKDKVGAGAQRQQKSRGKHQVRGGFRGKGSGASRVPDGNRVTKRQNKRR